MAVPLPDLLTVAEAAAKLRIGESTLLAMVARGDLLAYRVGPREGRTLIDAADLAALPERLAVPRRDPRPSTPAHVEPGQGAALPRLLPHHIPIGDSHNGTRSPNIA